MSDNNEDLKKRKAEKDLNLDSKKIKEDNEEQEQEQEQENETSEIDNKNLDLQTRLKSLKPNKKTLSDPIYKSKNGLIFTFNNGREKQATKDMNNILDEYIDKFKDIGNNNNKNSNGDDFDFNSAFEAELKQIKSQNGSKSIYNKFTLKCNGIAFFGFNDQNQNDSIDPIQLTSKIFKDVENTKTLKSKDVNRIIPIQKICHLSNLFDETKSLIDQYFNNDSNKIYKYKIEFKSRMNNKIDKKEYIVELAKLVDSKHQVDLDDPELTIIIEIVNFYCFLSIVSNYNQCKRFNLILLAGLPASNEPKKNKKENNNKNKNNKEEKD